MKARKFTDLYAFAVATIVAIGAIAFSMQFPRAEDAHSGPGSFPLFLGAVLAVLSVCGLTLSARKSPRLGRSLALPKSDSQDVPNGRANLLMSRKMCMLLLAGATALYLLLMPMLGFISGTALLCMGALMILGYRNPTRALAAGFIAAFALYGIFGILMNVVLPKGWIG